MKKALYSILGAILLFSLAAAPYFLPANGTLIVVYYVLIIRALGGINDFVR
jgi:hypothetical protein